MITSSYTGKVTHISQDGVKTNCGRSCADWEQIDFAPSGFVSWEKNKSDCPRCGTAADFAKARTDLAQRWEEHMLFVEKRRVAMQKLSVTWQALIEELCPGASIEQHGFSYATFVTTVVEDEMEFEVKATVNLGWPLR